jgi:hypothetical protein
MICSLSANESMNSAPACLMEEGSFYMRLPRHLAETLIIYLVSLLCLL